MKTGIYTPFVKDGELWGSQINELPKPVNYDLWVKYGDFTQYGKTLTADCLKWQQAEQSVQSFKVDKKEYWNDNGDLFYKPEKDAPDFCRLVTDADTFRATLKDKTLINLEVL